MHTHLITIRVPSDGRRKQCLLESDGPPRSGEIERIVARLKDRFPGAEVVVEDLGDLSVYTVDEMLHAPVLAGL